MPTQFDFDPRTEGLLAHIQRMLPDLPRILGSEWPAFENRLQALLRQLEQPDVTPVVVEAQVLDLFAAYPRVIRERLRFSQICQIGSRGRKLSG